MVGLEGPKPAPKTCRKLFRAWNSMDCLTPVDSWLVSQQPILDVDCYSQIPGYIFGAESLSAISDFAKKIKAEKPALIYLMDRALDSFVIVCRSLEKLVLHSSAVIGDGGRMYVAPDVVPVYRSMLPLATVITPNYFEVELVHTQPLCSSKALIIPPESWLT